TNLQWLKGRQKTFFGQALGGPEKYNGRPMNQAHAHLDIEQKHFDRVAEHLVAVLRGAGVAPHLIQEVVAVVAPLAADIVNNSSPRAAHRQQRKDPKMQAQMTRRTNGKHAQNGDRNRNADTGSEQAKYADYAGQIAAIHRSQAVI